MKLLLPAALLLILSACSREEVATAALSNFCYKLDGKQVVFKAHAQSTPSPAKSYPDLVDITSDTVGTSVYMCVRYAKPAGSDAINYKLLSVITLDTHRQQVYYEGLTGKLVKTATGGWSGTFAGQGYASPRTDGPLRYEDFVSTTITEGIFTEVQP